MTPLGPFGKAYAYSDRLNRRFSVTMTIILWIVACACAVAVIGNFASVINASQLVETILVIIVIGDAVRVLLVFWIFRGSQQVFVGKLRGIPALFSNTMPVRATTYAWVFFEFVMLFAVVTDISKGIAVVQVHVLAVLFFHATLYPLRRGHAAFNY